ERADSEDVVVPEAELPQVLRHVDDVEVVADRERHTASRLPCVESNARVSAPRRARCHSSAPNIEPTTCRLCTRARSVLSAAMARPVTTRDKLVDAAARLFAERGIDNVSINEIVRAAGQRNASAVHYHFGNR